MSHWTERAFRENPSVFRRNLEAELENAPGEVEDLLALLADHGVDPATALDVPCGIGRHSVELAARGVSVRGVDISESYLERARELARERDVAARTTFERGDMRDLDERSDTYDLVLNAWTSFGYYDPETDRELLRGLSERTAAGGATVLELVNREGVLADYQPGVVLDDDDRLVAESHEYDPETARMRTDRRVFVPADGPPGDGGAADERAGYDFVGEMTYDVRLYAPAELAALCRQVGFADVSLYAGLDGADLERESTRLVVVAEP